MQFLDIELTDQWFIAIIIIIVIILIILLSIISTHKKSSHKFEITTVKLQGQLNEKTLMIEKIQSDTKGYSQELANKLFEAWKITELETQKKFFENNANEKAKNELGTWLFLNEKRIRQDSAHKSLKTNIGKVAEHLLPFSHLFSQFNPKDARFIGSPIDLIVFDGICDEKEKVDIVFIEIKTGRSRFSPSQKKIREAIEGKRVHWIPMSVSDKDFDLDLEP